MRIRTFAFIISLTIISGMTLSKFVPDKTTQTYCVRASATRSHGENGVWNTDYTDERGNVWNVIQDERPEIVPYVLVINDNGTPYDVTDDVVENII